MSSINQTPKDISNTIINLQRKHRFNLPTESQDNPSKKKLDYKTQDDSVLQKNLKEFKKIIYTFIKSTSPEVNVSNIKNNVGYVARISKKEITYIVHPENTLKDPTTYFFNLETVKLTNKTTEQSAVAFTSMFLYHMKDLFDDIQNNRAKIKE